MIKRTLESTTCSESNLRPANENKESAVWDVGATNSVAIENFYSNFQTTNGEEKMPEQINAKGREAALVTFEELVKELFQIVEGASDNELSDVDLYFATNEENSAWTLTMDGLEVVAVPGLWDGIMTCRHFDLSDEGRFSAEEIAYKFLYDWNRWVNSGKDMPSLEECIESAMESMGVAA